MRELFLLLLFLSGTACYGGNVEKQQQTDSLSVILQSTSDSARIPILLTLCWDLRNTAPGKAAEYGIEAITLAERFNDYDNLAKAYSFVGVAYRIMGKYSESIDYYIKGHEIAEKYSISKQVGYAHLNLANLYIYQEHYSLAIDYLKQSEETALQTDDKPMLAYVYLYYGRAHKLQGDFEAALVSYRKSLAIRKELGQTAEEATCYKYIGDIYFEMNQLSSADENYNQSLAKIDRENDQDLYSNLLVQKSMILLRENKLHEASEMAHKGLAIACKTGANLAIRDALKTLVSISSATHDYRSAYNLQQKVIQYNDSLFSQKLSEKIFSVEYQMAEQQREIKIDLLNKDNAIKELEIKRIRIITFGLTIVLVLLVTTFVFLLLTLKHKRDKAILLELQNQEIIDQRNNIEEKNKRLTETNEKLERSEDNLTKMIQTKDKLFSIIAHDLRGPFNALGGMTEVLKNHAAGLKQEEVTEYASIIHESSRKLMNLIENLLQWANSQTGRLKIIPRVLSLNNIVDEVFRILKDQAAAKEIALKNDLPDNMSVYADYDSLSTIIRNLVSNGVKYTGEGSVTLSAFYQGNNTVIKVSDTGVGISPEIIKKLFKIEESFTTEGTDNEPGSGLGLIISKEFVERNNGTIDVVSAPGHGTTFILTLPAKEQSGE